MIGGTQGEPLMLTLEIVAKDFHPFPTRVRHFPLEIWDCIFKLVSASTTMSIVLVIVITPGEKERKESYTSD